MRIVGVGVDITSIARISEILQKGYRQRFITRVLHWREIDRMKRVASREEESRFVAERWAIKEAIVKAASNTGLVFSGVNSVQAMKVELSEENLHILRPI